MAIDYKQKYLDIRDKLIDASDVAYRLGFEQGMKEGQMAAQQQQMQEQMMMEQQQAEAEAMAAAQGGDPEAMDGVPPEAPGEEMPPEMSEEEGSELDDHISELENMVAKGEKPKILDIRKVVEAMGTLRKAQKSKSEKQVEKRVSQQKNMVDNILKKWEKEADTDSVTKQLEDTIKEHGLKIEG